MAEIELEQRDGIGFVIINRPDKRNAFHLDMWRLLKRVVAQCEEDRSIKAVVFRGVDASAFAAGADIGEFKTLRSTAEGAARYNRIAMAAEEAIRLLSKPAIAMIQGYCIGGGCEIAMACDFRFSDATGKFGITPAKLGLVYNTPGTKDLVDLVGPANAKDILYTGRILSAEEAHRIGLVDRLYGEDLAARTVEYAAAIAANAQLWVRGAKRIVRNVLGGAVDDDPQTSRLILESFESDDYKEGVAAFMNKRKPVFTHN